MPTTFTYGIIVLNIPTVTALKLTHSRRTLGSIKPLVGRHN